MNFEPEYKIKAFVSSQSGTNKYDNIRKTLKKLLEDTGLVQVYLFEDSHASTLDVEDSYLGKLEDNDVCIFLIDNKDDASEGVLKEHLRAQNLQKKSIYIFCDENEKNPTKIQNELKKSKKQQYKIVHEFSELKNEGIQSLMNDIIDIYRGYCGDRLCKEEIESHQQLSTIDVTQMRINSKVTYANLNSTNNFFNEIIGLKNNITNIETTPFDLFCESVGKMLYHGNMITLIDLNSFLADKKEELGPLFPIIEKRWYAIIDYWNNEFDECLIKLKEAHELAKSNNSASWLINDILVDLRYVESIKNSITHSSEFWADNEIQNSTEKLYYPLIDRFDEQLNELCLKGYIKQGLASPYSVTLFDSYDSHINMISNILATATLNGSLVHILRIKKRVKNLLHLLCLKYDNWSFKKLLLAHVIEEQNFKHTSDVISSIENIGNMNAMDSMKIYESMKTVPVLYQQFIAKLDTFCFLGYYLSDDDFSKIYSDLKKEIGIWLSQPDPIHFVGYHIFPALSFNYLRIDNTQIAEICLNTLKMKDLMLDEKIFGALDIIFKNLPPELIVDIVETVHEYIIQKHRISSELKNLILTIQSSLYYSEELNSTIELYLPDFFKNEYSIIFLSRLGTESEYKIQHWIKEIWQLNIIQGKEGVYPGYNLNPFWMIEKILEEENITEESLKEILIAVKETLLSPRQLLRIKDDANNLLIFLSKKSTWMHKLRDLYGEIITNELTFEAKEIDMYQTSFWEYEFNLLITGTLLNLKSTQAINDSLSQRNRSNLVDLINSLETISKIPLIQNLNETTLEILVQYCMEATYNTEAEVRLVSVKALINLVTYNTSKMILTRLSQLMNIEEPHIKDQILFNLPNLKKYDSDGMCDFIVKKAKIDNHFWIRNHISIINQ